MTTNIVETESTQAVVTENTVTNVIEVTSAGPAGPPGGALTIQDEGVDEGILTDKINFVGSTVSVVNDTEAEIATITVNAADPGANTNITSLGGITGGISSPDYVQFDTAASAAGAVGRLLWNDTDGTLEFQLKGGNVTLQIGQEQVVRVTNKSGVTMTDGQAVYITGSTGNHLNVTLAQANTEATSSKTLAIVTETIANNGTGFATSAGLVRGLNTSALAEGAAIWLSATVPGGLTTIRPTAPDHAVLIGWCVRQSATVGAIFVHIANGYELDELHDVLITAASNNQVLRYDAVAKVWKNATVSPTLTLTGDVSGSATFTDLGNATLTATVADDSHNHIIGNVDGLQAALDSKLPAVDYNAADVLTKLKTVDGVDSGLDADLLDGQDGAHYLDFTNATNKPDPTITLAGDATGSVTLTDLASGTLNVTVVDDSHNHVIANVDGLQDALDAKLPSASYTATDVLDKIKTVDGAGSGLDADLLDGQSSAYYTAINDRLGYTAENAANKGVAGGYASLDGAGLVPATQLPSYVDDVLEFTDVAAFPVTGETGKIYVAIDTSKTYRWSGTTYVEISASPGSTDAVPEGSSNLYFTAARARQSISASGSLSYDNNTGVMSFTDAVTSVAGRTGDITLSTSDVSEGTNLYHTTARVRSSISASGSLAYDNVTGIVSYTTPNTDGITEGAANLYHTTARARASVSAGTGISYDSATGVITNAAPDRTVAITGDGTTTVTGTYPNFTVSSADQYVGTVTSVSGTGTVNGLTLTGTVTSSGSLMLGGTLTGVDLTSAVTGTLPVAKGGTGTTTQFTAGSVVFAGASGVYSQDNANLFWDDTNNRLGIGTTSPSNKLQVSGDDARSAAQAATTAGRAFLEAQASDYWSGSTFAGASLSQFGSAATGTTVGLSNASLGMLRFQNGSAGLIYTNGTAPIVFGTNSSERMRIDSSGQVGVGGAPFAKFDVIGADGNAVYMRTLASTQTGAQINLKTNYSSSVPVYGFFYNGNTGLGNPAFQTATIITAGAERMRIDSSGNVGIGTSSPGYKLDISGSGDVTRLTSSTTSSGMLMADSGGTIRVGTRSGAAIFDTGGSERMRIDASGNVGIGTSSPSEKLDVNGVIKGGVANGVTLAMADNSAIRNTATGGNTMYFDSGVGAGSTGGDLNFRTTASYTSRLYINGSSGNVGIGTSSPGAKLDVRGDAIVTNATNGVLLGATDGAIELFSSSSAAYIDFKTNSSEDYDCRVQQLSNGLVFFTGGNATAAERMRIDSSGRALVQTSSAFDSTAWLQSYNATAGWYPLALKQNFSATATQIAFWNTNGVVGTISTNGTATAYNTSSDYRLKDVDGPITNSGSYIDALKPVQGSWRSDGSRFIGLIAHEVQEVSETPIATGEKDGKEMQAMDYSAPEIIANLIAEIQSLRIRVAQLETSASTITFTGEK